MYCDHFSILYFINHCRTGDSVACQLFFFLRYACHAAVGSFCMSGAARFLPDGACFFFAAKVDARRSPPR